MFFGIVLGYFDLLNLGLNTTGKPFYLYIYLIRLFIRTMDFDYWNSLDIIDELRKCDAHAIRALSPNKKPAVLVRTLLGARNLNMGNVFQTQI